jgi:hypothetical protein
MTRWGAPFFSSKNINSFVLPLGASRSIALPPVTDGLAAFLDASQISSYPGTGSTWFDLSGNGRNYSIGTNISWNSNGYFVFSGGTMSGPASNTWGFATTNNHYIEAVVRPSATSPNNFFNWEATPNTGTNTRAIQTHLLLDNGFTYYDVSGCCDANQRIFYTNDSSLTSGRNHFAWRTRTNVTPHRQMFKNSVSQVNSGSNSTGTVTWNRTTAATIGNSFVGELWAIAIYTRGLTDDERTSNYNYFKLRFSTP